MDDIFNPKEYGWTESSDSNINSDPFADDSESNSRTSVDFEVPFARHEPIIEADPTDLPTQRDFWVIVLLASLCATGSFRSKLAINPNCPTI